MKQRKGQFTIPNLVGVAVLFFIFSVVGEAWLIPVLQQTTNQLLSTGGTGETLAAAVLVSLPAVILVGIFTSPFALAQKLFIRKRQQQRLRQ